VLLPAPNRKRPGISLLPMINVVFLLLIFFLISARMTPPEAFPVTPPTAAQAQAAEADGRFVLLVGLDGRLGYRAAVEDAALAALAQARVQHCAVADCAADPPRLGLRVDGALPAIDLARILPRVAALGFDRTELIARKGAAP
jgi:biopolymer transport protein ExbD